MSDDLQPIWQVLISHQAEKTLRRLDATLRARIDQAIHGLASDPFPANSRKLVGYADDYRLRVGDWRIIYTVRQQQLVILVVKIASRGQVYKK